MPRVQIVFDGVSRGAVTAATATKTAIHGVGDEAGKTTKRLNVFERALRYGVTRAMYAGVAGTVALGGGIAFLGIRFDDLKQRAQIAFTTMLGSGKKAQVFLNELQAFAAKTPFEFADLVRSSQRLLGMGLAAKQIIPTMTAVGNAVAGIGGSAESMDIATRAIGQIQAKGRLMAEEMMQLNEAGVFSWRDLAREIGTSVPKAMDLVQRGAVSSDAFLAAFQQSSQHRFKGMMEQQSHTFGGLLSTLKDNFTQLAGTAMKPLFDLMTRGMEGMVNDNGKLNARGQELARTFGVKLANAVSTVVSFFQQHWQEIADFLRGTWEVAGFFAKALETIAGWLDVIIGKTIGWKEAAKFIIAGILIGQVLKLAGAFKTLAGAEGIAAATGALSGKTGLLAAMTRLKGFGPITISIFLVYEAIKKGSNWLNDIPGANFVNEHLGGDWLNKQLGFGDKTKPGKGSLTGPAGGTPQSGSGHGHNERIDTRGNRAARATGQSIVSTAASQLGIPYTWGGPAILGHSTDCSGLVQAVLRKSGVRVGRTTYEQWKQGRAVNAQHLQPGDLVFFHMGKRGPEHVGIYIGDGLFIEDPHTGASVRTSKLAGRSGFVGARRYIPDVLGGQTAPDQSQLGGPSAADLIGAGGGGKKKSKGSTQATVIGVRGQIDAMLRDLPKGLSDAGQVAAKHLRDLRESLHVGMSSADLARTRVSIQRWGKVLADEIGKAKTAAAKAAREAADAAALALERRFGEAQRGVERIFDHESDVYVNSFNKATQARIETMRKGFAVVLKGMRAQFSAEMRAFDAETDRGLKGLQAPDETASEAALRSLQESRAAADRARALEQALAGAQSPEERAQIQANAALDDQERALEIAARQERTAADEAARTAQDNYRAQRDLLKEALTEQEQAREDAAQEAFDAQVTAYEEARAEELRQWAERRDEQRIQLEQDLEDWRRWIGEKKKTWANFLAWLAKRGFAIPSTWFTDIDDDVIQRKIFGISASDTPNIPKPPTGVTAAAAYGGVVPGRYVGRKDTVLMRATPGERFISPEQDAWLQSIARSMGGGGSNYGPIYVLGTTEREVAQALAKLVGPEFDRRVFYDAER